MKPSAVPIQAPSEPGSWAQQAVKWASALAQEAQEEPTSVTHTPVMGRLLAGGALDAARALTPALKVRNVLPVGCIAAAHLLRCLPQCRGDLSYPGPYCPPPACSSAYVSRLPEESLANGDEVLRKHLCSPIHLTR